MKITNRYGDVYTFELLEDGNVQWSGDFAYCRYGFPNDYSIAYKEYLKNEVPHDHQLDLEEFKEEVHRSEYDKDDKYIGPCYTSKKYQDFVVSNKDVINMVDPSGGPYMKEGMEILGKTIKEFKPNSSGYLIITV